MDQYKLVKEIIKTCQYFKIVERDIDNYFVEKKIIDCLDYIIFVENLPMFIITKEIGRKNIFFIILYIKFSGINIIFFIIFTINTFIFITYLLTSNIYDIILRSIFDQKIHNVGNI